MADEVQVSRLKNGVVGWNRWRSKTQKSESNACSVDLSQADLRGEDLSGADLRAADLREACLNMADLSAANLSGANLSGAFLSVTDLSRAYLTRANLRRANLRRADLSLADLNSADLTGASLLGATLCKTILSTAVFNNALLGQTVIANTDLSPAIGLGNCRHYGPSMIDHLTLRESGTLPLGFLQGCGLSDLLIDYLPSLANDPIQFHSTFISYSSQDEEFARRIYADMQSKGIRCWFAPEDMKIGDKIRSRIDQVIHMHQKLLLILSEKSIKSSWVEKEVETAFEREDKNNEAMLFPIRIDDTPLSVDVGWVADIKRTRHIGDFRKWKDHDAYSASLERLLRDLKIPRPSEPI